MKTTYVGTRGYQAPELLLNQPYDLSCDIFSAGVVLFILLTGYPPFEQATKKDRWFSPLANGEYNKFWKLHRGCNIHNDEKAKDIIQNMLEFDPKKRITISDIKKHDYFNSKYLEGKELIKALRVKHRLMESKRCKDARKISDLQNSIIRRPIPDIDKINNQPKLYPLNAIEGVYDTYTFVNWKTFFNKIYDFIGSIGGEPEFDAHNFILTGLIKFEQQQQQQKPPSLLKIEIQMWKSREYMNVKAPESLDDEGDDDNTINKKPQLNNNDDQIYVVRIKRLDGDLTQYKKFEAMMLEKLGDVFCGLPSWIDQVIDLKKHDDDLINYKEKQLNQQEIEEEEDNYSQFIEQEGQFDE